MEETSMHILQVIPALEIGGAETMVVGLSNALVQSGHSVHILTQFGCIADRYSKSIDSKVSSIQCWQNNVTKIRVLSSLPLWILRNRKLLLKFDVIHCHLSFGLLFGVYFRILKKFSGKSHSKLIYTNHSIGGNNPYLNKLMLSLGYPFFSSYICVAESTFLRKLKTILPLKNLKTVFNGIILETSSKIFQAKDIYTIGTLSRLTSDRDPEKFIEIFSEVQKRKGHLKFEYIIGGKGPLISKLKESAHRMGVLDKIVFIEEVQNPTEFTRKIDLYITRTVGEMTGIAGLEAMNCGTPVIGLQSLRSFEVPKNAWIWSSNDPKEVAEKITDYFYEPSQLEKLSLAQHIILENKYTNEIMVRKYLLEYMKTA
jgi:glycosyltransferase involved in cell wall biosynthesis